jgi:hypothetical protein
MRYAEIDALTLQDRNSIIICSFALQQLQFQMAYHTSRPQILTHPPPLVIVQRKHGINYKRMSVSLFRKVIIERYSRTSTLSLFYRDKSKV